ncbi:4764_t:CDS:1, partial [Paraglomus occultum]
MDPCIDSYQHTEGPDDALVRSLVFDYLIHNCYGETAKAFFKDRQEIEGDGYGERLFWENDGEWTGVGTETGKGT